MAKKIQKYPAPAKDSNALFLKPLKFRTAAQEYYAQTLNEAVLTFCLGPAGVGKTYIATYIALQHLIEKDVQQIIITKPIIEAADEKLGYLPGEIDEKTRPYFEALRQNFIQHIGPMKTEDLIKSGKIKFIPAAYLRGMTLSDAFIIVDEAQNLTRKGMKLITTRLGENSYMCVNGDENQIDLPKPTDSGLVPAADALLGKTSDIQVVQFHENDVVRNPLIKTILKHLP